MAYAFCILIGVMLGVMGMCVVIFLAMRGKPL